MFFAQYTVIISTDQNMLISLLLFDLIAVKMWVCLATTPLETACSTVNVAR